jgi:hypothetical protein
MGLDFVPYGVDAVLELRAQDVAALSAVVEARPQGLQPLELAAAAVVLVIARELVGEGVVAREGAGEDHPGLVAQRRGKLPALRDTRALVGDPVVHDQRDARVAQRVEPGTDGEARHHVEGRDALGGDAELALQVERARAPGELDGLLRPLDRLEVRALGLALDQTRDVLVHHGAPEAARDDVDPLLAVEDPAHVLVVEDALVARQAEGGAGHHRRRGGGGPGRRPVDQVRAPLQHLGEEPAELQVGAFGESGPAGRRDL